MASEGIHSWKEAKETLFALRAHQVLPVYLDALVPRAHLDRTVGEEKKDQGVCLALREYVV